MKPVLDFARARLGERSTRVQLAMLALFAAVALGLVTTDQIEALNTALGRTLALLAPLLPILAGGLTADRAPTPAQIEAAIGSLPGAAEAKARIEATVAQVDGAAASVLAALEGRQ